MELQTVIESAALALAAAAGTSAWADARKGVVALFGRFGRDPQQQLDADAGIIAEAVGTQGEAAARAKVSRAWQERLTELAAGTPDAAEGIRALGERITGPNVQHITASAPNATAQGVMFGSIVNHQAPPPPR
ncbi:hypothetical protein [Actinoplanes sp. NPDC051494]|uniref:hypothetical protein n=1 Tax=Actinoplanes sp. NPDC051494 TaxID=3363907 RepID=UPI0037B41C13